MLPIRDAVELVRTILTKDSKAIGPSFWLIYNPAVLGLFVWTAIDPESSLSFIPLSNEISAASHFIAEFAIVNAFLVPFGFYTSVINKSFEQEAHSFVVPRILLIDSAVQEKKRPGRPIHSQALTKDAVHLFWARIFSCCSLSLISFLLPALFYLYLHLFGLLPEDNLTTPILVSVRFPVFITSLALLASALAVGIGLSADRKWSLVVATIVTLPVLFGGVIFDAFQGRHDRQFIVELLETYGSTLSAPVVFVGLSLVMSQLFKATFRHNKARTR